MCETLENALNVIENADTGLENNAYLIDLRVFAVMTLL